MALFEGYQIALDLTTSVRFKAKSQLRKSITDNGGIVSYIVTKKSTHVVCNDPEKADISYKCKMAAKYGIPVVSLEFIEKSVEKGRLLNTDDFLVVGKSKSEEFSSGKITATKFQKKEKKKQARPVINAGSFKLWKSDDKNCPKYPSDYQLAKFAMFKCQRKEKNKMQTMFAVIEIHVQDKVSGERSADNFKFRVASHSGSLHSVERGNKGVIEYRFCSTSEEALAIFSHMYMERQQSPHSMQQVHELFSRHIGSEKFRQMMAELGLEACAMAPPVGELVEHIWREAMGEIASIISVPVPSIKAEQIEKAEAILKQIKSELGTDGEENSPKMEELMGEFYSSLPHYPQHRVMSPSKAWLSRKQDICQLIRDMVSVSEATDWSTRSGTESKYKALRCGIEQLLKTSPEFKTVRETVITSMQQSASSINIQGIFAVNRPVENANFRKDISPKQLLFHSSKVENFVGILSRGLMLPKVVVDDFGGTRSDPGMLGSGIYFASDASTSVIYSTASKTKGTRLLLVNEVALGNCLDKHEHDLTLTSPPEGYDSVHGVKTTDSSPSEFKNDEYVVYSVDQQRAQYLVEFTTGADKVQSLDMSDVDQYGDVEITDLIQEIGLKDVKDVTDPMSNVKAGLVSGSDTPIDLVGVHIRAKLLDLASEVVVLQEYHNKSAETLEAKYVFPLGEMAAVCGFEAFINGKHIVGEVKEKEIAHKEYKKAVSEGHGAYLMDQDEETPDVFTVSVGNLPPLAAVLIKITYVAELQVEEEMISFRLPGSVAPWKKEANLKEITQHDTETVEVSEGETSVQVAVEMPFDIRSIECPTNKVKLKQTMTNATVELLANQSISAGFQLLIGLAEIHVPRMWVERKTGNHMLQACMLSFYPEFEACEDDNVDVVLLLDVSNSMKGDNLREAKKVLLLTLQHLPSSWRFNIVVFGTAFRELFPVCVTATLGNLKQARDFVLKLSANMGNTEVIRPMHTFYLLRHESSMQNVFLISDGHINNEETMLNNVYKNSHHTRVFTMGISSTANRHLLRALARVGAGAYEFFDTKVKSKWQGKVKSHINKAAQPGLTSVSVDWEQHGDTQADAPVQAPRTVTALFNGSRQVVYGYVPNCTMATLKATIAGQEVSTVVSTSELNITEGKILHRLTARAIISDWDDGILSADRTDHEIAKMTSKGYIIDLSKEYSIVTQFTSFVAIEKRDKDDVESIDVPTMAELVEKEDVDKLKYIGFKDDKPPDMETKYYTGPPPLIEEQQLALRRHSFHSSDSSSEDSDSSDYSSSTGVSVDPWEVKNEDRSLDMLLEIQLEESVHSSVAERSMLLDLEEAQERLEAGMTALADCENMMEVDTSMNMPLWEESEEADDDDDMVYDLFDDGEVIVDDGEVTPFVTLSDNILQKETEPSVKLLAQTAYDSRPMKHSQDDMIFLTDEPVHYMMCAEPQPSTGEADEDYVELSSYSPTFVDAPSMKSSFGAAPPQQLSLSASSLQTSLFGTAPSQTSFGTAPPETSVFRGGITNALFGSDQPQAAPFGGAPPLASRQQGFSFGDGPPRPLPSQELSFGGAPPLAPRQQGFSFGDGPPPPRGPPPPLPPQELTFGGAFLPPSLPQRLSFEGAPPPPPPPQALTFGGAPLPPLLSQRLSVGKAPPPSQELSFGEAPPPGPPTYLETSFDDAHEKVSPPPPTTQAFGAPSIVHRKVFGEFPKLVSCVDKKSDRASPEIARSYMECIKGKKMSKEKSAKTDDLVAVTGSVEKAIFKELLSKTISQPPPGGAAPALSHTTKAMPPPPPTPPPTTLQRRFVQTVSSKPLPTDAGESGRGSLLSSMRSNSIRKKAPDSAFVDELRARFTDTRADEPERKLPARFTDTRADEPERVSVDLLPAMLVQRRAPPAHVTNSASIPPVFMAKKMMAGKRVKEREKKQEAEKDIDTCDMTKSKSEDIQEQKKDFPSWRTSGIIDVGIDRDHGNYEVARHGRDQKARKRMTRTCSIKMSNEMAARADIDEAHVSLLRSFEDLDVGYVAQMKTFDSDIKPTPSRTMTLDEYGIGSGVLSCLRGTPDLSVKTLGKLLDMQHDGYWVIDQRIERILGIDYSICVRTLKAAGLLSLGTRVYEGITKLVSTGLVCWSVLKQFSSPGTLPMDFRNSELVMETFLAVIATLEKLEQSGDLKLSRGVTVSMTFMSAISYMIDEDKRYPLVSSTLELGHSWEVVIANMLEIHRPDDGNKRTREEKQSEEIPRVEKTWKEIGVAFEIPV